jgi:hypothetical protein
MDMKTVELIKNRGTSGRIDKGKSKYLDIVVKNGDVKMNIAYLSGIVVGVKVTEGSVIKKWDLEDVSGVEFVSDKAVVEYLFY